MSTGEFAGIDESRAQPRTAQHDQQECNGGCENGKGEPAAPRAQSWHRRASWNWPATRAVGQRAGFTSVAGTRAAPAAFGFAGFRFQHRCTLERGLASATAIRPQTARLALRGVAANPLLIWSLVGVRVKTCGGQLFAHRVPP